MVGVIAAGGKGTRLSSIAVDIPKPMVDIAGKPILQYQIECLKENGIKNIYLLIGFLGDVIKNYFGDGSKFGVHITYVEEREPLGSAGGLFFLKDTINSDFVFLFGDLMIDIFIKKMFSFHKKNGAMITLLSHPNSHPFDSDLVIANANNLVVGMDSKNNDRNYFYRNLVNSGVYIVSDRVLKKYFTKLKKVDFEKDILVNEICFKSVFSYCSTEYVKDIGTPDRYNSVSDDVINKKVKSKNLKNKQKCIFLDRDGTINVYKGFINKTEEIELEEKAAEGIATINKSGYLAIVITNQPVVARGEATKDELLLMHNKIETLLGRKGAYIDDLFYCPHHPDQGFEGEIKELKVNCNCRKPKIGLLLAAEKKYNIDLEKSFIVGDTTSDIQTGINAGVKTILVRTGCGGKDKKFNVTPDFIIDDLSEIKKIIGE